jgi:hypothetical protein
VHAAVEIFAVVTQVGSSPSSLRQCPASAADSSCRAEPAFQEMPQKNGLPRRGLAPNRLTLKFELNLPFFPSCTGAFVMISSVSSSNSLVTTLEANGLSAAKAKLVNADASAASKAVSSAIGTSASRTNSTAVRTILNAKIDADVASGKLSTTDAVAVKKTLDDIDSQLTGPTAAQSSTGAAGPEQASGSSAAAGSASRGGGAAGGGTTAKTEASETVIVAGAIKTTVITYTDGTTSTSTTAATDEDQAKYDKASTASSAKNDVSQKYLSGITPGTLFNQSI